MKDWQQHIRHTAADKSKMSWCGETLVFDWAFVNIDRAAYHGLAQGRLQPCPKCLKAVVSALKG